MGTEEDTDSNLGHSLESLRKDIKRQILEVFKSQKDKKKTWILKCHQSQGQYFQEEEVVKSVKCY